MHITPRNFELFYAVRVGPDRSMCTQLLLVLHHGHDQLFY